MGDGLSLDLGDATTRHRLVVRAGEAGLVIGADVAHLVGEGLDGLGGVDVLADADGAVVEAGVSVGAVAVPAFEGEAVVVSEQREVGPEVLGFGAGEQTRIGRERGAVGLADVEDVDDAEPAQHLRGVTTGIGRRLDGCGRVGAVEAGSEDRDALLAVAHVAAELVPGAVSGDAGGLGELDADEDDVGRAVVGHPGSDGEHPLPGVAVGEVVDCGGELLVQRDEPVGPCGCARRCAHQVRLPAQTGSVQPSYPARDTKPFSIWARVTR